MWAGLYSLHSHLELDTKQIAGPGYLLFHDDPLLQLNRGQLQRHEIFSNILGGWEGCKFFRNLMRILLRKLTLNCWVPCRSIRSTNVFYKSTTKNLSMEVSKEREREREP